MRTIDEVIFFLEDRQKTEDWNVRDDAIQYLREFKELIKMWNDKLDREQENDPLTWDELKQMEGKPVWVEYDGYKPMWDIVDKIIDKRTIETYKCMLHEEGVGIYWQAYRKEQ